MNAERITWVETVRDTPLGDLARGRFTRRLNWEACLAASDLPVAARREIRSVVHLTRLRRSEKADIAWELRAHFEDGLESGATEEEILAKFGDRRRTARLIRRAKLRHRSVAEKSLRRAVYALALFGIVYGSVLGSIALRKSGPSRDPHSRMSAFWVDDDAETSAWPEMRDIMARDGFRDFPHRFRIPRPSGEAWSEAKEWLEKREALVARIHEFSNAPRLGMRPQSGWGPFEDVWRDYYGKRFTASESEVAKSASAASIHNAARYLYQPYLGPLSRMKEIIALKLRVDLEVGDGVAILENYRTGARLTRLGLETPESYTFQTHGAREFIDHFERPILRALEADRDLAARLDLRALMGSMDSNQDLFETDPEIGRVLFYDYVDRAYSEGPKGRPILAAYRISRVWKGEWMERMVPNLWEANEAVIRHYFMDPSAPFAWGVAPLLEPFVARKEALIQEYEAIRCGFEAFVGGPLWESDNEPNYYQRFEALNPVRYMGLVDIGSSAITHPLSVLTLKERLAIRESLRLVLALEGYRDEEGQYPKKLEAVVPEWIEEIPVDHSSGGPLRYKVANDASLLYGVGRDGVDDGGDDGYRTIRWWSDEVLEGEDWILFEGAGYRDASAVGVSRRSPG